MKKNYKKKEYVFYTLDQRITYYEKILLRVLDKLDYLIAERDFRIEYKKRKSK
jgi:hypothetical protein